MVKPEQSVNGHIVNAPRLPKGERNLAYKIERVQTWLVRMSAPDPLNTAIDTSASALRAAVDCPSGQS